MNFELLIYDIERFLSIEFMAWYDFLLYYSINHKMWVARLTRNVEVVGSSHIKGIRCFLEQETLPLLLSTGWFQERI